VRGLLGYSIRVASSLAGPRQPMRHSRAQRLGAGGWCWRLQRAGQAPDGGRVGHAAPSCLYLLAAGAAPQCGAARASACLRRRWQWRSCRLRRHKVAAARIHAAA